jgi:hypothetical protein
VTLDCRKAQFAADEPIARLRMICQSWKVMFHAEYCSGQPLCILVDLRTAVESALGKKSSDLTPQRQPAPELKTEPTAEPQLEVKAKVAAASVVLENRGAVAETGSSASSDAPEFDVSVAPPTWDGDSSG